MLVMSKIVVFMFNDTATTEIYTLSLHDALPISTPVAPPGTVSSAGWKTQRTVPGRPSSELSASAAPSRTVVCTSCPQAWQRSEEHTSELQPRQYLVCRLLLEKNKPHLPHDNAIA